MTSQRKASLLIASLVTVVLASGCSTANDTMTMQDGVVSSSTAPAPGPSAPTDPADGEAVAAEIVSKGMAEDEAVQFAESRGYTVRVVQRDDEMFAMTMDYRPDRLNFTVKNGVVTQATVG